jgi:acetyltransferase-like isoleucine patch superfamily enzyme
MTGVATASLERMRRRQHMRRMAWMPWLYFQAPPEIRAWAEPWQQRIHDRLRQLEAAELDPRCFIAPDAKVFAEPMRPVRVAAGASIAAQAYVHGPVDLDENVSINTGARLEGGRAGIRIGRDSRIATGVVIYAFNHGLAPDRSVRDQPVSSLGVRIGKDVWIGANAGITDGVCIEDHAVVGMGAIVTKDVPAWRIVAGVPARPIGDRRDGRR